MGQANRRGTYEERKASAIASGKVKTKRITRREISKISHDLALEMLLLGGGGKDGILLHARHARRT